MPRLSAVADAAVDRSPVHESQGTLAHAGVRHRDRTGRASSWSSVSASSVTSQHTRPRRPHTCATSGPGCGMLTPNEGHWSRQPSCSASLASLPSWPRSPGSTSPKASRSAQLYPTRPSGVDRRHSRSSGEGASRAPGTGHHPDRHPTAGRHPFGTPQPAGQAIGNRRVGVNSATPRTLVAYHPHRDPARERHHADRRAPPPRRRTQGAPWSPFRQLPGRPLR